MEDRLLYLMSQLPQDVDGALITSEVNRRYYTGFPSSAGVLAVSRGKCRLFVDFRYYEAARKGAACEVSLLTDSKEQLGRFCRDNGLSTVALESEATLGQLRRYQKDFPQLTFQTDGGLSEVITAQRRHKSKDELAHIMAAQKITDDSFAYICNFIAKGKTEREIALALEFYSRQIGSEEASFDFIAASGANAALPHAVYGDKPLCDGDFLILDFGAVVNGYHSDMTRTVAIGHVTQEMEQVYHTVREAQEAALAGIHVGMDCREADRLARDVIEQGGYGAHFGHALGHSVGLQVHEAPSLSRESKDKCAIGDIFTVEPGIYLSGRLGCRIEDMIFMGPDGVLNLTHSPKALTIL